MKTVFAAVTKDVASLVMLCIKIGVVMALMGSGTGAFIYQNF